MKLLFVLIVCAVAAATPKNQKLQSIQLDDLDEDENIQNFNILINALVRQMFEIMRKIIKNGSPTFGIPILDPLDLDHYHLVIPAGLINLDLELKNIHVSGVGDFKVHKSTLNLRRMTFDIDMSIPVLNIRADEYDLDGDLYTAIPLYGKGKANFVVERFRFQAKLHLKQSDDLKSILIDKITELDFDIPVFKSDITGAIGGGDIDPIVNAMIEEVIIDYVLRFRGAISLLAASVAPVGINKVLSQLDTWKYIAPLMPKL